MNEELVEIDEGIYVRYGEIEGETEEEMLEDAMLVDFFNFKPILLDTLQTWIRYKGRFDPRAFPQVVEILHEANSYIRTLNNIKNLRFYDQDVIDLMKTVLALLRDAIKYTNHVPEIKETMKELIKQLEGVLIRYRSPPSSFHSLESDDQDVPEHVRRAREITPMMEHLEFSEEDLAESMRPIDPFEEADQLLLDAVKRLYEMPDHFKPRGLKSKPEYLHRSETQDNLAKLGELIIKLEKQLREKYEQA